MKPLNFRFLNPFLSVATFAAIVFTTIFAGNIQADSFIGAGEPRLRREMSKGGERPPAEVFDIDTDTGIRSNIQQFTARGPAFLTAMDRDSSGTLWGISEPNRLVTIDEETGRVTDVVQLTTSDPDADLRGIPAIAFVPGEKDSLYAIASFSTRAGIGAPTKSNILDGFLLVEVDTTTGVITPTYPEIGGRYGSNLTHGLEYDPLYGLVHMWSNDETDELKANDIGIAVELLDLDTAMSEQIPYSGPDPFAFLKTDSGIIPDGFQATVHSGTDGVIYVFQGDGGINLAATKNPSSSSLLAIEIIDNDGDLSYTTCFEGEVFVSPGMLPINGPILFRSRAMELTGDGSSLLIDFGGLLSAFAREYDLETLPEEKGDVGLSWYPAGSVMTSIGGYAPEFDSLATDPITGLVYALSGSEKDFRFTIAGLEKANEKEFSDAPSVGLNIIDRNGPAIQELDGFDVPLTDPFSMMQGVPKEFGRISPLTLVQAIAFDDTGVLYGIASEQFLVTIDLPTGEVSPVREFDSDLTTNGYNYQMEFNPADGRLYILFYGYSFGDRPAGLTLVSVNRDGTDPESTPVPGFFGEGPTSMVTAGPNSFVFAALNPELSSLKRVEGDDFQFFGLGVDGMISPPFPGGVNDIKITALTQIPFVPTNAIPDVLIGDKRDRLDGDNIYNPNAGSSQTVSIRDESKTLKGQFFAEIQNDGQTAAVFSISARGGKNSDDIKYLSDLGNITADVKRGLLAPLGAGAKIGVRVKVSRDGDRKFKEKFRIQAIAGGRADAGVAKFKIKQPKSKRLVKPNDLFRQ